jgi:hypothetical protein
VQAPARWSELVLPPATKAVAPFKVSVPQSAIDDLERRLASTRWPERETVGTTYAAGGFLRIAVEKGWAGHGLTHESELISSRLATRHVRFRAPPAARLMLHPGQRMEEHTRMIAHTSLAVSDYSRSK